MSTPADLLRQYLRQRQELGEHQLFSDRYSAEEIEAMARRPPAERMPSASETSQRAIVQLGSLDELRARALSCTACGLAGGRTHVVFGEGSSSARLMVVGEAPGAEEDRTGLPFVGRAGKLLSLLLASAGMAREEVYICNVLKCRPPGNRDPQPDEVVACETFLRRQVEMVAPEVILACGTFAAQTLLGTQTSIGRLRGALHDYQGIPLVPTYHPAALLRNSGWVRPVWEDLQRARAVLEPS